MQPVRIQGGGVGEASLVKPYTRIPYMLLPSASCDAIASRFYLVTLRVAASFNPLL